MVLVLDVGNTNIVAAGFVDGRIVRSVRWATYPLRSVDAYACLLVELFDRLPGVALDGCCIASVVPPVLAPLTQACASFAHHPPLVVSSSVDTGLKICYENPESLGVDRIVNAAAAWHRYRRACIVVDCGTAITIDCVSARGEFLGGAIAPGLGTSFEALCARAAQLRAVPLAFPGRVIGRSTTEALQAGTMYGYLGLIEGIVSRMRGECGGSAAVIATGGQAAVIAAGSSTIQEVDPELTLWGLDRIHAMNRSDI